MQQKRTTKTTIKMQYAKMQKRLSDTTYTTLS